MGVTGANARIAKGVRRLVPAGLRPIGMLTEGVRRSAKGRIVRGPFKGMKYVEEAVGSCYIPKLLGIYEREIAVAIEAICDMNPRSLVVLGGGEGYYAVGMALRVPGIRVICYEGDTRGRALIQEMAGFNGVGDRVEVRGWATVEELSELVRSERPAALICDVEGAEKQLLDPDKAPGLERVSLLVETHDFVERGITELLESRFRDTREIEVIHQTERTRRDFDPVPIVARLLPGRYADWAVSEWRPEPMKWLWMKAK